ncbi:MAG: hypothetical protein WD342_11950 [Verrucomicrobiales bacterium]
MKRTLLIVALAPTLCLAENLVKDGTMDTATVWSGDRKFETIDDNRVLVLESKRNRNAKVATDVKTRDLHDLVITFRYKSADFEGRGIQLLCTRPDSSYVYQNVNVRADDKWHEHTWNFSEVRDARSLEFSIELLEGSGSVLIDDVVIIPRPTD